MAALVGVDVGGTFTDVAVLYEGRVTTAKVSTTPDDQSRGIVEGVELALERAGLDPDQVGHLGHGTTVATNALLERRGARTGFVATRGFGDLLDLARQTRAHLYRPCVQRPAPLPVVSAEIDERLGPDAVLRPLDPASVRTAANRLRRARVEAVAVCLLHSYADPRHEAETARLLRELLPDAFVVASHEIAAEYREYERASTAAMDAYLGPVAGRYLQRLGEALAVRGLPEPELMQSSGGLAALAEAAAHPARLLLSGPAGGVAAVVATGGRDAIGFDMGGTSCDVSLIRAGVPGRSTERAVGGLPVRLPMLDIHTVGAGGGSIAWIDDGGALRVGPQSAGAVPGPACYERGGTLPTVTDANVVLRRLDPGTPLAGGLQLDRAAAERAVASVADGFPSLRAAAEGIVAVANQEMVRAIRVVSVEQGHDPRRFELYAFGGAGPLHACEVAEELGVRRVVVPAEGGVLSALGIASCERRRDGVRGVVRPLSELGVAELRDLLPKLPRERGALVETTADLRYRGQGFELNVALEPLKTLPARFHEHHELRFGFSDRGGEIELINLREAVIGQAPVVAPARWPRVAPVTGPARVDLEGATLWVAKGWNARRGFGRGMEGDAVTDPATLQVMGSALRGVAEEMGAALVRAAHSANIKERRDCSTAVFDRRGRMIAQAEHMPVHLGAMPDAVAAVLELGPKRGETFVVNDPYTGGTHLPDITLVSAAADGLGYLVSRAHHADVGGMAPASLPVGARELYQEGLVIPPLRLTDEVVALMVANMRNPAQRLADLRAQIACHVTGERRLAELAERFGRRRLLAGMDELFAASERRIRAAIGRLPDGTATAQDVMEGDGLREEDIAIEVAVTVAGEELVIDFAGTAPQQPGNVNCPIAVTRSAVYHVVRLVCDPDIPASGGAYAPVTVLAPSGCLVNARFPGAVVAGNVETSSRIADVVLAAFGGFVPVPAMGQGTMNNVSFGNERFTHYETIGGGQGACPDADGPSAVHVAMSNTLNTPIEALEREHPLQIERYQLRRGSGGAGLHHGGDGVVRGYRILEPMRVSVMSERRRHLPRGEAGGGDAKPGENRLNGRKIPAKVQLELDAGDVLEIRTPGGGGWGKPPRS